MGFGSPPDKIFNRKLEIIKKRMLSVLQGAEIGSLSIWENDSQAVTAIIML